jgi:catechol 2,3-dioxygenase-like lactoylglutathione lyase family enzyme
MILEGDTTASAGFGDAGSGATRGLAHHLGLEVSDLQATEAHLRAHGANIIGGPLPRGDGAVQLYVLDPDGNFLEFFVWDKTSSLPVEERASMPRST